MPTLGRIRRMFHRDGLSLSEISRRTSLSRNTIRDWLKKPEGSVPKRGIYDNMKTAVDKVGAGKARQVNARFAAMASHYLARNRYAVPCEWVGQMVCIRLDPERVALVRLYGMAGAWADLTAQGSVGIDSSRWLIEHRLQAERTDRAMRSVCYQLKSARFPVHRDLAGFDFSHTKVDEPGCLV